MSSEGHRHRERLATVEVEVGARLHMGFINPVPGPGRSFGSIGLALEAPYTRLLLQRQAQPGARGPDSDRALAALRRSAEILRLAPAAQVNIERSIPPHTGLGSGTQLALAVGMGLARLDGRRVSARQIAGVTERGARSGIGTGAFEQGGFLLDGGRGRSEGVPPVISRLHFPERWPVVLVFDPGHQGLHGQQEIAAFKRLPGFPTEEVAHLARLVLTEVLPSLAEGALADFGAAISEIQERVGDHFAPAQGGRFASPAVAAALEYLRAGGACAIGQSSWGPTGFCVLGDEAQARDLVAAARRHFAARGPVQFLITRARNEGARIDRSDAGSPRAPADLIQSR